MKYFKKLEGERIYLSPMHPDDAEIYTKWLNDSAITRHLTIHNSLVSISGEKEYIEVCGKEEFNLCIVKKENDELMGNIALKDLDYKSGTCEIGIFIGEEKNLGKGYGSEAIRLLTDYAFKELRMHTIMLLVLASNLRAQKSYSKCGFVEFGRRHDAIFRNGKYQDVIYMELINPYE